MKTEQMLLLALGGYFAYKFVKGEGDKLFSEIGAAPGNFLSGITGGFGEQIGNAQEIISNQAENVGRGVVNVGGQANQFVNANRYQGLTTGAAGVMANMDFIGQATGINYANVSIAPTISGSGRVELRPASGMDLTLAQRAMDLAVRAIPASTPVYGVSRASGGMNVFNITPTGQAMGTAYKPTATTPATSGGTFAPSSPIGIANTATITQMMNTGRW